VLEVDDDSGVGRDVVDPVPRPVGSWHTGDEQQTVVVVQEDLDPPVPAGSAAGRRQVDDLAVVKGGADRVIHGCPQRPRASVCHGPREASRATVCDGSTLEKVGSVVGVDDHRVRADTKRFKEFIESRGSAENGCRGDVQAG
jgi:hypothetical protein